MNLAALFLSIWLPASQVALSGVVQDASDGQAIAGAIVRLLNDDGEMISYAMTDSEGCFSFPEDKGAVTLHVALLGYQERSFSAPFKSSYVIRLERSTERIQEAVVRANKIRMAGDTVQYNINALKTRDDYVIGDALKRLPGIEVLDNGKIRVDGRDVGQLLIDGKDVLNQNYSMAIKNLSVDAVASVDVIRGHQRVRMLRGIKESDETAINIRLAETARGQLITGGSLSGGWQDAEMKIPAAANASLFWLRDVFSTVDVVDYDSEGGVMKGFSDITAGVSGATYNINGHLGISPVSAPVGTRGAPFNSTIDGHSVNTIATSEISSFGVDMAYNDDWKDSSTRLISIYHIGEGKERVLNRDESREEKQNRLRGQVSYLRNGEKSFIREDLMADLTRGSGLSEISGDVERGLNAANRRWNAVNEFDLKLPLGTGRAVGVSSYTQFSGLSEQLIVAGAGPSQTMSSYSIWQDISVTGISRSKDAWTWSLQPGFHWRYFSWTGDLSGIPEKEVPGAKQGTIISSGWSAYLSWSLAWRKGKIRLEASGKHHYDRVHFGEYEAGKYFPDASIRFGYESGRWEFEGRAGVARSFPDQQSLGAIRMLTDYDKIRYGSASVSFLPQAYFSAWALFRDPVNGWNARIQSNYSFSNSRISGRDILDRYIVQYISEETVPVRKLNFTAECSKGIYAINGKITATLSHAQTVSSFSQNGQWSDYRSRSLTATLDLNVSPVDFWSCVLTTSGSWSFLLSSKAATSESGSYFVRLKNTFYPSRKLSLGAQIDVYYNTGVNTLHFFPDLFADWRVGRNIRLRLMANNLLNVKEYAYKTLSPLQDNIYTCRIRPLTILAGISFSR